MEWRKIECFWNLSMSKYASQSVKELKISSPLVNSTAYTELKSHFLLVLNNYLSVSKGNIIERYNIYYIYSSIDVVAEHNIIERYNIYYWHSSIDVTRKHKFPERYSRWPPSATLDIHSTWLKHNTCLPYFIYYSHPLLC